MVDVAYQSMVLVERNIQALENIRTSRLDPDWIQFLRKVARTPARYRAHGGGLDGVKAPAKNHCAEPVYEQQDLPAGWWNRRMGEIAFPVSIDFAGHGDCGVRKWTNDDILQVLQGPNGDGFRDHTGLVLGYWAASVDREFDDTHLWFRPTSAAGLGAAKRLIDQAGDTALAILLLPFVCAFDCIFGDCNDCDRDAKKLADDINPTDEIEGWIPGIGDLSGADWVGLWHHINMNDTASNEFDDRQGEFFEEAGPFEIKDPVDLVLMAAFDASGLSVNHDESRGVARYQIGSPDDGHTPTNMRSESQWQTFSLPHVPFEPVDNLAYFGWRSFRDDPGHAVKHLGWPMHAIGDATVPMHVTATSAWGHRPFEDSQVGLWRTVRYSKAAEGDQNAFAMRMLRIAYDAHKKVEAFRQAQNRPADVPVRLLVTDLAAATRQYALQKHAETAGDWPFSITASTEYVADVTAANRGYETKANAVEHVRPLFEAGIGTTIAFLVAAADSLPAQ